MVRIPNYWCSWGGSFGVGFRWGGFPVEHKGKGEGGREGGGWGRDRQRNRQVNAQALSKLPFSKRPFSFSPVWGNYMGRSFYLRLGLSCLRLVCVAYVKFGLVFSSYGGKSVWSFSLAVPPSGNWVWSFLLMVPPSGNWVWSFLLTVPAP